MVAILLKQSQHLFQVAQVLAHLLHLALDLDLELVVQYCHLFDLLAIVFLHLLIRKIAYIIYVHL